MGREERRGEPAIEHAYNDPCQVSNKGGIRIDNANQHEFSPGSVLDGDGHALQERRSERLKKNECELFGSLLTHDMCVAITT